MPIYEYQCADCGHRMEALQKISAAPLTDCPECQAHRLVKLVSASSFRLKGGGWYETDFKTGAKRHGVQDAAAEPAASSGSKSESAPVSAKTSGSDGSKSGGNDSAGSSAGSAPAAV